MRKFKKKTLKRILFVTNGFPFWGKHGAGGIGEFTYSIAKELTKYEVKVYVLGCSKHVDKKKFYKEGDLTALVIPFLTYKYGEEYLNRLKLNYLIFKYILFKRVQLVESPSYLGWVWPFKPWVPFIVRLHSSSSIDIINRGNIRKLSRKMRLELNTIRMADQIVCVCNYARDWLLKLNNNWSDKKTNVIYNGVDVDLFYPHSTPSKTSYVLFVGNISIPKGIIDLLEAWKIVLMHIESAKLKIVGQNQNNVVNEFLSQCNKKFRNSVELIGTVPNKSMAKFYNGASLVVVPSHCEANPLVVLEAMSCGCAVICPNHTGFSEIIENNIDGVFCNTKDPEMLSNEIVKLHTDEILKERLGKNARKKILIKFNKKIIFSDNYSLYTQIINSRIY